MSDPLPMPPTLHIPSRTRLEALQREIAQQVVLRTEGSDERFWGPTVRLMAAWAKELDHVLQARL